MASRTQLDLQLRNIDRVEAHVAAECSNDVEAILATVIDDCRFALTNRSGEGPPFQIATDKSGARAHYEGMRRTTEIVQSLHIKQVVSDWYLFYESVPTSRLVGELARQYGEGAECTSNSVVLFPVADGGIIGEIPYARFEMMDLLTGNPPPPPPPELIYPLPLLQVRNLDLHDRYLAAVKAGDIDATLGLVADGCRYAVRNYYSSNGGPTAVASDKAALRRYFQEMHRAVAIEDLILLNRIVGDWYVFAECLLRLRHRGTLFGIPATGVRFDVRTAAIYPITADGQILGELGYGTDMEGALRAAIEAERRTMPARA